MKQNGPGKRLMIAEPDAVGVCLGAWHCPNFHHKRNQRTRAGQEGSTHAPPTHRAVAGRERGFGVALVWLWCGFGVALGWLWGPNRLAINRLWCGFGVHF